MVLFDNDKQFLIIGNMTAIGRKHVAEQIRDEKVWLGYTHQKITRNMRLIPYKKGYQLHTITTTESDSKGIQDGDLIQATIIFELIEKDKFFKSKHS